jgi:hypothetical protein
MDLIDPRFRDLERKHSELESTVAQMRGELDELRRTPRDTSRQTIWQFVIFTVTMGAIIISAIKYQTDTLSREMEFVLRRRDRR